MCYPTTKTIDLNCRKMFVTFNFCSNKLCHYHNIRQLIALAIFLTLDHTR